jgi:hypothetical protein
MISMRPVALPEKRRTPLRNALEKYFGKRSAPRLALSLVLLLTGMVGWLISYALLKLGLSQMWLRYPLAVIGGYSFFLALLRLWVEIEKRRFDPALLAVRPLGHPDEEDQDRAGETGESMVVDLAGRTSSSWLDWLDFDLDFDLDAEGCLVGLLFGAILAAAVAVVLAIAGAPSLVAEVFLDAFLMAGLYRRLRRARRERWLGAAVRKTWRTALIVAVALSLAGGCLGMLAPGAHSIGPAWHRWQHGKDAEPPLERP